MTYFLSNLNEEDHKVLWYEQYDAVWNGFLKVLV